MLYTGGIVVIDEDFHGTAAEADEQSSLAQLFDSIIRERRLLPHFQPIVDLNAGKIIGYEGLIRGPSDSALHPPGLLFQAAMQLNRLVELEILCRDVNIEYFTRLNLPGKLFLNISPKSLLQPHFPKGFTRQALEKHGLDSNRVVIELTENFPILDVEIIRSALEHYRRSGFQVALDDLGAAYASLRLWSELKPDYVKFDKYFIQSINRDPHKKQLIKSLQDIAESVGCQTIAEGVETAEECYIVQCMGVTLGQGYYFSRPSPTPPLELPCDLLMQKAGCEESGLKWRTETVASLIRSVPTIHPQTTLNQAGELLVNSPELATLPVIDDDFAVGMLHRYDAMNILASRFGRDLHGNQPIHEFTDRHTLRIDIDTPIEKLSQIITSDTQDPQRCTCFIITEKGRYRGIGMVTDLLKRITDLQIRNARYANPLTLLPGSVPINEHLEKLMADRQPFTACYVDLDHFKPFNDVYGYSRGDMVIRLLGRLLQECCDASQDFIGHIGGDDFLVIFRGDDWRERCELLMDHFAEEVVELYDEEHRELKGIAAKDRQGNPAFYPFTSLSIGAVLFEGGCQRCSHHDISALAAESKTQAKKKPGNSLFINRRSC
ncbi:MAG: EAL and GGDEF domain-containing protein [Desulfuromonadaceae bacterium]|nr:EAL and GGDEF domain-containing protein [Desulfuromonadaceae bacterium]